MLIKYYMWHCILVEVTGNGLENRQRKLEGFDCIEHVLTLFCVAVLHQYCRELSVLWVLKYMFCMTVLIISLGSI